MVCNMAGTLLSLIIALILVFVPIPYEMIPNPFLISVVMIAVATLFLALLPYGLTLAWNPLQRAEQNSSPRILEMFRKDRHLRLASIWLILFPLIAYVLSLLFISEDNRRNIILLAIWLVLLGITRDATMHFIKRIYGYLNPFTSVEMFTREAKECIQDEKELDLCDRIDGIAEISLKAINKSSSSLANNALNQLQQIARLFLSSSKSISHHEQDSQTKALGITDKVSYTMFYLYQRLELIFRKALEQKLEPICSHILTLFGKISIDAAKYDMSMAGAPLHSIGKLAKEAQDAKMGDIALKASCTLLEVAKVILNEVDITYLELQEPFLSIINSLEELTKGAFKQDKTINIELLKQPFYELKELFTTEKAASHQDTPIIMQNIDRVIGEFSALELVLRTIPKIPEIPESDTAPPSENPPSPSAQP